MQAARAFSSVAEALRAGMPANGSADEGGRGAVLDAARAALLDFGARRTSMGEIARRAGVSQATLYRWFGSKDDIVLAVFVREARRFAAEVEASIDADASPEDQLAEAAVQVAEHLRAQALLRRLMETEPESVLSQLTVDAAPLIEAGTVFLSAHVRRVADATRLANVDPEALAEVLIRVVHSLLLTPATTLPLDDHDRLRASCRAVVRWIVNPDPRGDLR